MPDRTATSKASIKNKAPEAQRQRLGDDLPDRQASHVGGPTPMWPCLFERAAAWTIHVTGGRWGFLGALLVVIVWAFFGPFFHYSEVWQLVINTATTIVTFLMVFLI